MSRNRTVAAAIIAIAVALAACASPTAPPAAQEAVCPTLDTITWCPSVERDIPDVREP